MFAPSTRHRSGFARLLLVLVLLLSGLAMLQAAPPAPGARPGSTPARPAEGRDWQRFPAGIVRSDVARIAVIGDVHGAFAEMAASLQTLGVARRVTPDGFNLQWTGGKTTLVSLGDLNDRGLHTREVMEAMMDLQVQAQRAGGEVICLIGNHEMLLLNGQVEKWAQTLTSHKKQHYQNTLDSFTKAGLDFHQAISAAGRYGAWIRVRPVYAAIDGIFFIHAGLGNPPLARQEIEKRFQTVVDGEQWNAGLAMDNNGPLWLRDWWKDKALIDKGLQTLDARALVFGHTIGALGEEGTIGTLDQRLVAVDVGMTPSYGNSKGGGLLIERRPQGQSFTAVYPDRPAQPLFDLPLTPDR